jgi:predicted metal-binding membrane protein
MTTPVLETLLRRDRAIVLAALVAVALLAWASLAALPVRAGMEGMAMEPELGPWAPADAVLMFAMWAAMMTGMMTPSVAPMILLYARVARHAAQRARPFAPTGWFASGYLLAWCVFAAIATALQWLLERAATMSPAMALADRPLAGALLVAAGLYQWTPLKEACLGHCRSPLQFVQAHGGFRPQRAASLLLGLRHGLYCIGCCWALMLLLFVGGVMNLLWIATLAAVVLAEKLLPAGRLVARVTGVALLAGGALLLSGML